MATVTTIGGAMMDTIAVLDSAAIERITLSNADRSFLMLEEGSKTEAALISTHPGGGALNTAVCFARLGFQTSALLKLGVDARASAIRSTLTSEGISTAFVASTEAAETGASVLVSAFERNAAVFTYRGANALLEPTDIPTKSLAAAIVYITGLSNRSAELFPTIAEMACASGAFVAANPGIRQLTARGDTLVGSLKHLSLLSLNRDEAAALAVRLAESDRSQGNAFVGREPTADARLMREGLTSDPMAVSLTQFVRAVHARGTACVVITDGRHGAYAAMDGRIVFCPSLPVRVTGTAGAGDAFSSTFAAYFATGTAPEEAMVRATVNAASVVGVADAQSGLLRRDELERHCGELAERRSLQTWRF